MRNPKLKKALVHLVDEHGPIDGRTRLLKLVYLADSEYAQLHGSQYTEARYFRWNHGPFAREFLDALEWLDGVEIVEKRVYNGVGYGYEYRSGDRTRLASVVLDPDFVNRLDSVARKWARRPLQQLLKHVYDAEDFKEADFGDNLLRA